MLDSSPEPFVMFLRGPCQVDIHQASEFVLVHVGSGRSDHSMERFGGKRYIEEAVLGVHLLGVSYAHEGVQRPLESL
jgi:hypothetical protein